MESIYEQDYKMLIVIAYAHKPPFCLFVLILYVPVKSFSFMSGRVFLG